MEISVLPLTRCIVGEAFPGAGDLVVGGGGRQTQQVRILADLVCTLLIGGRVTRTAYEPVHLAVVAMDTGSLV